MNSEDFYQRTAYRLAAYLEQELKLQRGVHFRFSQAVDSFKILTLWLVINPAFTEKVIGMNRQLSQTVQLEKGAFIRIVWGGMGTVELQIPKPHELCHSPKVVSLPAFVGAKAAVGLDTVNRAAFVNFADPITTHILIASPTGTGKTNLIKVLTYGLAKQNQPDELRFLAIDVAKAGRTWDGFENVPHMMHDVISDTQVALGAMDWLVGELECRAKERRSTPRIIIFIDEFKELSRQRGFVEPCTKIAERGREWGINLVLATQRPTKESMGSMDILGNLGGRIVGPVPTGQQAAWATGIARSGADLLAYPGDMLLVRRGYAQRVATPLFGRTDLARLPRNGNGHGRELDIPEAFYDEDEESSSVGRPADPLNMAQMAIALAVPDVSQRAMTRHFSIGFGKAKRVLELAAQLRGELDKLGCEVGYRGKDGRLLRLRVSQ